MTVKQIPIIQGICNMFLAFWALHHLVSLGNLSADDEDGRITTAVKEPSQQVVHVPTCYTITRPVNETEMGVYIKGLLYRVEDAKYEAMKALIEMESSMFPVPDTIDIEISEFSKIIKLVKRTHNTDFNEKRMDMGKIMFDILKAFRSLELIWSESMKFDLKHIIKPHRSNDEKIPSKMSNITKYKPFLRVRRINITFTNKLTTLIAQTVSLNSTISLSISSNSSFESNGRSKRESLFHLIDCYTTLKLLMCYLRVTIPHMDYVNVYKKMNRLPKYLKPYVFLVDKSQIVVRDMILIKKYLTILDFLESKFRTPEGRQEIIEASFVN